MTTTEAAPADQVSPPTPTAGPPDRPLSPRNREKAHALGLTSATGLVIGSIVGTGVFTMPAVLAGAGTMGIVVLGVIAVGAMLLSILFGQLTKRVPNSDGGLYAYSRHEYGDFAGYLVGWCYWIQAWAGNAAIVSSWDLDADALVILTDVANVQTGFGTPSSRPVGRTTPAELRSLHLPTGSMGPKVEAACRFVESTGRPAMIGRLEDAAGLVAGTVGTVVEPGPGRPVLRGVGSGG